MGLETELPINLYFKVYFQVKQNRLAASQMLHPCSSTTVTQNFYLLLRNPNIDKLLGIICPLESLIILNQVIVFTIFISQNPFKTKVAPLYYSLSFYTLLYFLIFYIFHHTHPFLIFVTEVYSRNELEKYPEHTQVLNKTKHQ